MKTNKKMGLSFAIGIFFSGLAFYFTFKNIPFNELIIYLASVNYLWIFPTVSLVILSFVLRVVRWQIILGTRENIGFWRAFNPLMIGFMLNCVLPGRVGELARPAILQKNERVSFSTGIATVAAERVFDMAMLISLLLLVMTFVNIDPDFTMTFGKYRLSRDLLFDISSGMIKICIVMMICIIILCIDNARKKINNLLMKTPNFFFFLDENKKDKMRLKIITPLVGFIDNFALGFAMIKDPIKILLCLVLSATIWGISALGYYVMSIGSPGIELSYAQIAAYMIIICCFIALPSVPGFWGIWEAGGVFALSLFGVSYKDALGYTLSNHAIQIFPVIIIGFASAIYTGTNILETTRAKQ